MAFEQTNAVLRSSEEFNLVAYSRHQTRQSPFINSSIDVIKDFVLDYMHLVLLGTVKRLLSCKISSRQVQEISDKLCNFKNKIPTELARQPRALDELKRWKATEFRQFLLYTGPVVLKGSISENLYIYFLTLSVAMRMFLESNDEIRNHNKLYAKELLD